MSTKLENQRIVILGGSSGIGYAIARQALADRADVIITGRDASRLSEAKDRLGAVSTAQFDVNDFAALDAFLDSLPGTIDHLFVGAGSPLYSRLEDLDVATASAAIATSAALTLHLAKTAGPLIRPGGTIIFMGGTSARIATPGYAVINATMGSSTALIKTLALEIAPVRINQIAAGFVDTPLSARLLGDGLERRRADLRQQLPIRRVVTAEDVASLATHVMTNTALTGAVFDIDGGQQLLPPSRGLRSNHMAASDRYRALIAALLQDPDLDVTERDNDLYVGEHRFAFLAGARLALKLPTARANDLIRRNVVVPLNGEHDQLNRWVSVADTDDWAELASEAHTLASGHQPGRAS